MHQEAIWELTAWLAPAAQSLGPSPEASSWSPQLNSLRFRIQISLVGNTTSPHPQVLQEAKGASGRPAGRSWCALVNPAGPSWNLQVSALGSE